MKFKRLILNVNFAPGTNKLTPEETKRMNFFISDLLMKLSLKLKKFENENVNSISICFSNSEKEFHIMDFTKTNSPGMKKFCFVDHPIEIDKLFIATKEDKLLEEFITNKTKEVLSKIADYYNWDKSFIKLLE